MGVRQERRERRAKAEKEVRTELYQVTEYMRTHPGEFPKLVHLETLADLVEKRVSKDTAFRFKDVIKYEIMDMYRRYKEQEAKEKGGDKNG